MIVLLRKFLSFFRRSEEEPMREEREHRERIERAWEEVFRRWEEKRKADGSARVQVR